MAKAKAKTGTGRGGERKDGLFAKGGKGGPGRPPKAREEKYADALKKAVTFKDITDIAKTLVNKAKAGDEKAAKLLFEYLIGKPVERIESVSVIENTRQEIVYRVDPACAKGKKK